MDIDTEIVKMIQTSGKIRRNELVNAILSLNEQHPSERGLTKPTIDRHIKYLLRANSIIKIKFEQFSNYDVSDTDKNATYYALKNIYDYRIFIDEILPRLSSGDEATILTTLNEIERHRGRYRLSPKQLNSVVLALSYDKVIVEKALWILFYHLYDVKGKEVKPANIELFVKKLNELLSRFGENENFDANIYQRSLDILGLLQDPTVVTQLIKETKSLKQLMKAKDRYLGRFTADSIESQKKTLFDLEVDLRKTKSEETSKIADILVEIRTMAADYVYNRSEGNGDGSI
jgi:DNA-binding transcriptional ArsR family regulator